MSMVTLEVSWAPNPQYCAMWASLFLLGCWPLTHMAKGADVASRIGTAGGKKFLESASERQLTVLFWG